MRRRGTRAAIAVMVGTLMLVVTPAHAFDDTWARVGTGINSGISGLAPATSGWVVVRDNKAAGQNRVALLSDTGQVTPLAWPGTMPQDLESLARVPGGTQYAALTSTGHGTVFTLGSSWITVVRAFTVPRGGSNIEGFALTRSGTTTLALWAVRGSTTSPATLYAATFNPATGAFGTVTSGRVSVPYPTTNVRPVSDLTVVAGRVIASSASDNGDNGPFDSAVYDVGSVSLKSGRPVLSLGAPVTLGTYPGHKVEGIACSGSTGLLGTDDEKLGGWVRAGGFCG